MQNRVFGIKTDRAESFEIPYSEPRLILRGTSIFQEVTTETVKNRSISAARAIITGGLILTKTTRSVRETTTEERQGFLKLYSAGGSPYVFRERPLSMSRSARK